MSRGLTLLEVILAASLTGLIFIFMLNIFPASVMAVRQSEHRLAAHSQAQRLIDIAASRGFDQLANGVYTSTSAGPFGAALDPLKTDDNVILTSQVLVGPVGEGTQRDRIAKVRVTVGWLERERAVSVVREYRVSALKR